MTKSTLLDDCAMLANRALVSRCLDCGGAGAFVFHKGGDDYIDDVVEECKSCGGTGRPASEG